MRGALRGPANASPTRWYRLSLPFLSFLALLTLWATIPACNSRPDPQAAYDRVFDKIVHGDLQSAAKEADQAYQLYAPRSQEWAWRFRILRAQILISQSNAQAALALLQGDLPASLASSEVAVRKNLLEGIAYRIAQAFPDSERKLAQAEQLANSYHPALLCEVLNARGALEVDERKHSAAEATFDQALASARQQNNARQQLTALGNLARVAILQRQFGKGVDQSEAALKISRSLGTQSVEATLVGNLGWYYFQLGDFENALASFKQAADASQRLGITGYSFYWQGSMAQIYEELHDYAAAETLLKSTLENARKLDNKQTMTESLNYLSRLSLITDHPAEAELYNREALQIEDAGLDHFGVLESQMLAGRIATKRKDFAQAEIRFRRVIQDPAAETFLKWEAEAGLAELYDSKSLRALADQEYRKSINTFELDRSAIDRDDLRLSFLARGIASYDAYIDFLIRQGRSQEALKVADQSRARTLEEGLASTAQLPSVSPSNLHPQEIARKLAPLLFYWIGQNHSYLWVITPTKTNCFKLPPASVIDPVVSDYRKALLRMHDAQDDGSAEGEKLYAMLVEPAKKLLPPGSHVIVLPSESLYGLNFETLIVPGPQPHFWIEDVTLTTGSSLSMLAGSADRPTSKEKSLFLVGDTKPPNPPFAPLPQAPEEMKQVRKYFPGAQTRVLEGVGATPSAFLKNNPEQFSYLHFVAHGTASRTRPLESAVILSQEGDSYKLYARDIVQHRLNANLVTISACNGAGTRAYSGEGLVGLSWAFLRAGAHNVIGALWEVSDASTPQLMDAFYRELFQGKDTATALRDAKLTLLHSRDPDSVFKNPFYWAPFQLYAGS